MFKRAAQEILLHPECQLDGNRFHLLTESELIAELKSEQQRLQLTGSAELLDGTIYRRLHKVGAVIHPGERKRALMDYLYELFHNPDKRREKEIELCHTFSQKQGDLFQVTKY